MQNSELHEPTKEIGYLFRRGGFYVLGKQAAENMGHVAAHQNMLGIATAVGSTAGAAGLVTIGLAGAVSGMLSQMDYIHRKDNITEMYKDEMGARLNKPADKVTRDDLDTLAKENKTLGEELKQIKRQRTFGIGLSILATMASLGAVKAFAAISAATFGAGGAGAGIAAATAGVIGTGGLGILGVLATMGVALASYNMVKKPLHHLADKLFDLDYKTTHDHVMHIQKKHLAGKTITPDQVLSVFVASNPQLAQMIERQTGQSYENLSEEKKHKVAQQMNEVLPLERIAHSVNAGGIKATEIAFLVDQQPSGIEHHHAQEKSGMGKVVEHCKKMFTPNKHKEEGADVAAAARHYDAHNARAITGENQHDHAALAMSKEPKMAFVERLERSKADAALGVHQPS